MSVCAFFWTPSRQQSVKWNLWKCRNKWKVIKIWWNFNEKNAFAKNVKIVITLQMGAAKKPQFENDRKKVIRKISMNLGDATTTFFFWLVFIWRTTSPAFQKLVNIKRIAHVWVTKEFGSRNRHASIKVGDTNTWITNGVAAAGKA